MAEITYHALGTRVVETSVTTTGGPRAAAREFFVQQQYWPDWVEWVDTAGEEQGVEIVGGCETCEGPILEGDSHDGDPDGVLMHLGPCPEIGGLHG